MARTWTVPLRRLAIVPLMLLVSGCDDGFFDVRNREGVDLDLIDPAEHADLIARSAFQNLATAYTNLAVFSGWWAHEARVGDSDPARNQVGLRRVDESATGGLQMWSALARSASIAEHATRDLRPTGGLPLAISSFAVGYSLILMAEHFCEGTVSVEPGVPGRRMNTVELLDLAIVRLEEAERVGVEVRGDEAIKLATAARVGIARAHLFAGRNLEALEAARGVPDSFEMMLTYVDSHEDRARLSNAVWNSTSFRPSLVVPPEYRAAADAGDPRIRYADAGRLAQDSELHFFMQLKFPSYAAPMRLASGLEARYLAAEASGDPSTVAALIAERRAAAGQPPFTDTAPGALRSELMRQRALDFWLEAKKMGDVRRAPDAAAFFPPAGAPYYKARLGHFEDQRCWAVPVSETGSNPFWN
jgi:starch-binding outer membrane protein, SusD/RagB family